MHEMKDSTGIQPFILVARAVFIDGMTVDAEPIGV